MVIIELIINKGVRLFWSRGARGFDTIASIYFWGIKKYIRKSDLYLFCPCQEQTKYWNDKDKKVYEYIKCKADKIVYTSEKYTNGCMFNRNKWLVNNSNYCIAHCIKNKVGRFYTVITLKKRVLKLLIQEEIMQYFIKKQGQNK